MSIFPWPGRNLCVQTVWLLLCQRNVSAVLGLLRMHLHILVLRCVSSVFHAGQHNTFETISQNVYFSLQFNKKKKWKNNTYFKNRGVNVKVREASHLSREYLRGFRRRSASRSGALACSTSPCSSTCAADRRQIEINWIWIFWSWIHLSRRCEQVLRQHPGDDWLQALYMVEDVLGRVYPSHCRRECSALIQPYI